ncbi:lymphocyte antigen 6H-like [Phascolarctos cinereus]|uniref:Lymphocyte antigen 6H-like n=1 Tax=Phascolarctos cinereus TaxID=38626 RepID=A0A6P5L1I1_PHACI|nr:lymphocyte antigen 6H-like [Phascolarctos cinereus]
MKILISVLLGALLFVESAHCLQCHACTVVNHAGVCQTKTCSHGESTCFKVLLTHSASRVKSYVKDCTTSCKDVKSSLAMLQIQGFSVHVNCCDTDLCNGVDGVRSNLWALAGALLLSLGPALLWFGL